MILGSAGYSSANKARLVFTFPYPGPVPDVTRPLYTSEDMLAQQSDLIRTIGGDSFSRLKAFKVLDILAFLGMRIPAYTVH